MKKVLSVLVAGFAASFAFAETWDLFVDSGTSQTYSSIDSKYSKIIKTGAGRVDFTGASEGFSGTIEICEGVVGAGVQYAVGKGSTVVVSNGAQFASTKTVNKQYGYTFHDINFILAGNGPDERGALVHEEVGNDECMFGNVTLLADSSIGNYGGGNIGFANAGKTADLNNFNLTIKGKKFMFFNANYKNVKNIYYGSTAAVFQGKTTWENVTAENLWVFRNDCVFQFYGTPTKFDFTLTADPGVEKVQLQVGTKLFADGYNTWSGPIVLPAGMTLVLTTYSNNYTTETSLGITGKISGEGSVKAVGQGRPHGFYLCNPENSYTGGTIISGKNTMLYATCKGAIPDEENLTVEAGGLNLVVGDENWSITDAVQLIENVGATASSPRIYTEEGVAVEYNQPMSISPLRIVHDGPGSYAYSSPLSGVVGFYNYGGTFTVKGTADSVSEFEKGGLKIEDGTLVLEDVGYINASNKLSRTNIKGSKSPSFSKLVLKGDTVIDFGKNKSDMTYYTDIVVEVADNAIITNNTYITSDDTKKDECAAFHIKGGALFNTCYSGGGDGVVGRKGYGCYDIVDGTLAISGYIGFGVNTNSIADGDEGYEHLGYGVLSLRGGTVKLGNGGACCFGRGGFGEFYQSGGTFDSANSRVKISEGQWSKPNVGGRGVFTMDGENAHAIIRKEFYLAERTNGVAILNLNRGVLEGCPVFKSLDFSGGDNAKAYVNFNGGTYRALNDKLDLFPKASYGGNEKYAVNAVTIHEGGAVIDTNGKGVTISHSMVKPTGKVVASVELPDEEDFPRTNFRGPMPIVFSGDNGTASAITDFDSDTCSISKVIVTSPGFDCGENVTAYVRNGAYTTNRFPCKVTMKDAVGGGLSVIGGGTLTLTSELNTWAGATVVSNATLKVGVVGALPANTPIAVKKGGTLNLNNLGAVETPNLQLNGTIANGDVTVRDTFTIDALALGEAGSMTGNLTFSDGTTISVLNADQIDASGKSFTLVKTDGVITGAPILEEGTLENPYWKIIVSADKKTLRLGMASNTVIIIR